MTHECHDVQQYVYYRKSRHNHWLGICIILLCYALISNRADNTALAHYGLAVGYTIGIFESKRDNIIVAVATIVFESVCE